ncbi:MAG: hypothetical protein D6732_05055 [Methanobacteriota archaeon]|nr:MAG: hypothetical protein D6732_05055 [Euryarchaeota archaeon]
MVTFIFKESKIFPVTSLFQLVKDYTRFFQTDEIPDYDFLKLSTTHRKFDALMRRFWDAFHPLTKDIFTSFVFEISTLLDTLEELKKEVSIKEREVQKVTKELNERREYIANLLEKLERDVATQLSLTEEEIKALEEESKAKTEMVEKLQQEVMMLKSELNSQSTLSSDAVTEAVLLDQKLSAYEQEIEDQKEVIEKLTFDNVQLMEQNISLQRNSETLMKRVEELELKLGQANSRIEFLEKDLLSKEKMNDELRKEIVNLKANKISEGLPEKEKDTFEEMMGKSDILDLKKDMMTLTRVIKEDLSTQPAVERSQDTIEELKKHLTSLFNAIRTKDPTVDLYNLKEEIKEVANKDPYGLLPIIEDLLSIALGNLMETKLEEIKREFLIEKIQLQSEIVQLRNRLIDLTGSMEEPLKIKKELDEMFEKETEAPQLNQKLDLDQEPQSTTLDLTNEFVQVNEESNDTPNSFAIEESEPTLQLKEEKSLKDALLEQLEMKEAPKQFETHEISEMPEEDIHTKSEKMEKKETQQKDIDEKSVGSLLERFEKKLNSSQKWLADEDQEM